MTEKYLQDVLQGNYDKVKKYANHIFDIKNFTKVYLYLYIAFVWRDTNEGTNYWRNLTHDLRDKNL